MPAIEYILGGVAPPNSGFPAIWEAYFNWYRSTFTPSVSWFLIGILLILLEVLVPLPTMLIAGAMGISAMAVALVLLVVPVSLHIAVTIPLWTAFSGLLIWYSRRFVPKTAFNLKEATEGTTITEILPGESGRVQYEGVSWKARCDNHKIMIPAGEKVYVLRRQGTTLIVVPESWLQEHH